MLKSLTILPERIADPTNYPFTVPAIASLRALNLTARVTFFVGENGSGKSTLLEAIAAHIGFGREGGNRNISSEATASVRACDPLTRALRLAFDVRAGDGFYFRAESLYNFAAFMDQSDEDQKFDPGTPLKTSYGGISLHERSHGEAFFTVLHHKFRRSGLFLLDEPEAALSPARQLAFLALIHSTLADHRNAQFLISTHSPILLGYPGAQILSFDGGTIHDIPYEETETYVITRRFLNHPSSILKELFRPADPGEDQADSHLPLFPR